MKLTEKREKILNAIKKSSEALSAKELTSSLPEMDQATIYRNLNLLAENGVVKKFTFTGKESLYEINEKNHHHAVCDDCEKVRHLHISDKKILDSLDLKDFEVEGVEVILRGRCK